MKTIRWVSPTLACAITVVLAAAALGAQAPVAPGAGPAAAPPVSLALGVAATPAAGEQAFSPTQPVIRVGLGYTLRSGEVASDVRSVFGDVTIEGHVERDTVVVLGDVRLAPSAAVDGALVVIGGTATIDQGATVSRDLVVAGGNLFAPRGFAPGGGYVVIGGAALGDTLKAFAPWLTRGLLWGRLLVPSVAWAWLIAGVAFLVYLVVNTLFEGPVGLSADAVQAKPLSVFLLGLLVLVLTVPAILILAATIIGIAIVPFVLCGLFVAGLVGKTGVTRAMGRSVLRRASPETRVQSAGSFVLGASLLTASYLVPVLGLVAWSLTSVMAVGAAAMMLRGRLRHEHPARERVEARPPEHPAADAPGERQEPEPGRPEELPGRSEELQEPGPEPLPRPLTAAGNLSSFSRAAFFDRVAAFALDCVLVGIVVALLDLSRYNGAFPLLLLSYHIAFWAWKGTTLGGIVVGLRVVRLRGADLQFADAFVRGLSGLFSLAAVGIGCFWMLQDPERQMWHDKIAGTLVVKVPRQMLLP